MVRRLPFVLVALILVSAYGFHAWRGIVGSLSLLEGKAAAEEYEVADAVAAFDRAVTGELRFEALAEMADAQLDSWLTDAYYGGRTAPDPALLSGAVEATLRAMCESPGSRRPWQTLGTTYELMEWSAREARTGARLYELPDPWAAVGEPGRISIGLARLAVERAPNWYAVHDRLARRLWNLGLHDEALESVRRAAQALPILARHNFSSESAEDPEQMQAFLEVFSEASWAALGSTPLLHPVDHLIDIGKLELLRDRPEQAAEALQRALEGGGDAINRAEASFNLGIAMTLLERPEKAADLFRDASDQHPAFVTPALTQLASIAERAGDAPAAMRHLRGLRRIDPKNAEYCLRFAAAARLIGDWDAALEALRWAKLNHPADPRVLRALGEAQLGAGDPGAARVTLDALRSIEGAEGEVLRLRAAIEERGAL